MPAVFKCLTVYISIMASLFTLDIGGTLLAVLFGIALIYFGLSMWWLFLAVMVDFLVLSSIVTKAGDDEKSKIRGYEKVRGWKNVVANGIVPVAIAALYFVDSTYGFFPVKILVFAFIASICSITADKFASEFGVLAGDPIGIFDFKRKRKGTSGAITPFGTGMGVVASILVGAAYFAIGSSLLIFLVIVVSGVFGNFVDSVLGHFEEKGIGSKYTSNLLCSLAGALLCAAVLAYIL